MRKRGLTLQWLPQRRHAQEHLRQHRRRRLVQVRLPWRQFRMRVQVHLPHLRLCKPWQQQQSPLQRPRRRLHHYHRHRHHRQLKRNRRLRHVMFLCKLS